MPPRKRPAHFELADGAVFEAHQADRVVFGFDRVDLRVGPHSDFDRSNVFADEAADDLDAVAAEVDDRAAAGKLLVPEPIAVGPGVRFARADPEDLAERRLGGRIRRP